MSDMETIDLSLLNSDIRSPRTCSNNNYNRNWEIEVLVCFCCCCYCFMLWYFIHFTSAYCLPNIVAGTFTACMGMGLVGLCVGQV